MVFGKVKKWLGIEGVKMELVVPDTISSNSNEINGVIRFYSMNEQTVTSIRVVLVEKYVRGRRKSKLTDEYLLGEITMEKEFVVPKDEVLEIDFELPFDIVKSEMDDFGEKNILTGQIVKFAKLLRGAKSQYRIETEATVKGVKLNPFDVKTIGLN